ncbi:MAG: helix-turn-helix domain-containing protein [Halalkalicoccus sp.]
MRGVRQQIVGDDCHTDVTLEPEECDCAEDDCSDLVHVETEVEAACLCAVFAEFGSVPQLTDVSGDRIVIETYLPDRERLAELVEELKTVVDGLSLRRLKRVERVDAKERSQTITLDLFELTEKQREAATAAVAAGYYASPRETSIGDLAADLNISSSAMSQRLTAVESKLALAAFEGRA